MGDKLKSAEEQPLPTKQQLLDFILSAPEGLSRRELARAFHLKDTDRVYLKRTLRELANEGAVVERAKKYSRPGHADYMHVVIESVNEKGFAIGRPTQWDQGKIAPSVSISLHPAERKRGRKLPLNVGDFAIVKLRPGKGRMSGTFVRKVEGETQRVIGIFISSPNGGGTVQATDRKQRALYTINAEDTLSAKDQDIVAATPTSAPRNGQGVAKITEILGSIKEPKSLSLIAVYTYDLPLEFSEAATQIAEAGRIPVLGARADLRDVPLVTIDDEDARDFDDAVFAEPDPDHPGGWHLIVAIADVSYYVKQNDALDQEAYKRGNSVYFPDRVIPMLPEVLSNGLCSLNPHEDRATMAVHLWIDDKGQLQRFKFVRGLMRSAARLTYRRIQAMIEGNETFPEGLETSIRNLYKAYDLLKAARVKRGTLELDLPEERIYLDDKGEINKIEPRPRFDSNQLVEEFMILANVAAATALSEKNELCMYRIHDQPSPEKVDALRDFSKGCDITLPKGQIMRPKNFNQILSKAKGTAFEAAVNDLVLRTQAQAVYSPDNIGHFGLSLARYAHFTSPIRRYADLLVHRALIKALKLDTSIDFRYGSEEFNEKAEHISQTERRAANAERETIARYVSAYLAAHVGEIFTARVTGVTSFGLFVRILENGAEGLVPMRLLGTDYFIFDEAHQRLVGRRTKHIYALGDRLDVVLQQADVLTGGLQFAPAPTTQERRQKPKKARPKKGRIKR